MNRAFHLPALLLLTAGLAAPLEAASSWPQFRGLNSGGIAEGDKPPVEFGPTDNLLWSVAVPGGVSSPSISGDRIFLTGSTGETLVTVALSRRDGRVLWRQEIKGEKPREIHKKNNPAAATPATDGERVCVFHPTFGLVGYDVGGRELWRQPMPGLLARNGSGTSPAMLQGRLILNCDVEEGKSFLTAFDPATGREWWRVSRADSVSSYTTPVLWKHDGRDDIIIVGSLLTTAYDWADGKQRWFSRGTEAVSVAPTPVLGENQLYVMSRSFGGAQLPPFLLFAAGTDKDGDGKISRAEAPRQLIEQGAFSGIDRDQDGYLTEKEWADALVFLGKADHGIFALRSPGPEGQGDLTGSHIVWKHQKGVASVSSPLYYRGRIYIVQDGGRFSCIEAKSGSKLFEQERLGVEGEYFASPVAADGKIYLCSTKGTVVVAKAGDTLEVLARNEIGEAIMATPAIADDQFYLRTAGHFWAFGRK